MSCAIFAREICNLWDNLKFKRSMRGGGKNCKLIFEPFEILWYSVIIIRDFVKNNYNWLCIAQLGR